jgi:predicted nucleic acid-binding protein
MKPMSAKVFFDSNIILYALTTDARKAATTETLLAFGGTISVQVLNELVSVSLKKFKLPLQTVHATLTALRTTLDVVPVTMAVHERGLHLIGKYKFSPYDAMIVAAAQLADCKVLYSEDMHDGQVIDGLTISNPYKLG